MNCDLIKPLQFQIIFLKFLIEKIFEALFMELKRITDRANILFESHRYREVLTLLSERVLAEYQSEVLVSLKSTAEAILKLRKEIIRESLESFENVDHRMEVVGVIDEVTFINDSKATNVNSTWYAIESIESPIVLIIGGTDKGNEYSEIVDLVQRKVRALVCLGVDNTRIYESFEEYIDIIVEANSAEEAVDFSFALAKPGDTVLLSPACASFDRFQNYEDRGNQFKESVQRLSQNVRAIFLHDCSLYLSTDDENVAQLVFDFLKKATVTFGLILFSEDQPIISSWFKRFRLRAIKAWDSKSTQDKLKQIEYALNLHSVKLTQSETDANYINALANFIEASKNETEIVLNIGALIYIKSKNGLNEPTVYIKTLTTDQLVLIEKNPELVKNPSALINLLSESNDGSRENS